MDLRPYHHPEDLPALASLWGACLGEAWPLPEASLADFLAREPEGPDGLALVAEDQGAVRGVALASRAREGVGGLSLLLVHPDSRGQGFGRALLEAAEAWLRQRGVTRLRLGPARTRTLFPGPPVDLVGIEGFFERFGYAQVGETVDLAQDLRAYPPPGADPAPLDPEITLRHPEADEAARLLDFEREHFLAWAPPFERVLARGGLDECLLAVDPEGELAGALRMSSLARRPCLDDHRWQGMLGAGMGSIGMVGVSRKFRRRGIGLAMVARAAELLRERGVERCWIHWTELVDWYGRLGFEVWRRYRTMEKST